MKEITVGMGQSIDLDPGRYSYDIDGLLTGKKLTYKYYCRLVIDGLPQQFQSDSYNNYLDLKQIKDRNLANVTCLTNTSKGLFSKQLK